jgi:3-demethoxyubiquinol 3-hydroxylase
MLVRVVSLSSTNFRANSQILSRNLTSAVYTNSAQRGDPAITTTPHNLTPPQRDVLDSALRVDQAGEIAANWIYKGQLFILGRDPSAGPLIQVCLSTFP